jgi:hypothetical protein
MLPLKESSLDLLEVYPVDEVEILKGFLNLESNDDLEVILLATLDVEVGREINLGASISPGNPQGRKGGVVAKFVC